MAKIPRIRGNTRQQKTTHNYAILRTLPAQIPRGIPQQSGNKGVGCIYARQKQVGASK